MIGFGKQKRIDESESKQESTDAEVDDDFSSFDQWLGMAFSLTAAWTLSFNAIYNRKLKNLNYNIVLFHYGIIGTVAFGAVLVIQSMVTGEFETYDTETYLYLFSGAVTDMLCTNSLTIAF